MQITVIALIISILGLISSFFLVGILPSAVSLVLGIRLFLRDKSIETFRVIAISLTGIAIPIIMYINTYGLRLPHDYAEDTNAFTYILVNNYSGLGLDFEGKEKETGRASAEESAKESGKASEKGSGKEGAESSAGLVFEDFEDDEKRDDTYYVTSQDPDELNERLKAMSQETEAEETESSIFESLDSIPEDEKNKGGVVSIAASDDNMPSYGGLPVGTILLGQYFREDDHNCNPVLVLQNRTGDLARYECRFIARDKDGEELADSNKTVEVVRNEAIFVFEGRFDKRDLGGKIPETYEFSITKRTPYEEDVADSISVYTAIEGSSAVLTAENKSNVRAKVDAYVLFFDGRELVDCMWMIPQNTGEVCIDPGSSAVIRGDAYYRFDRVETYYTAYKAVEAAEDDGE